MASTASNSFHSQPQTPTASTASKSHLRPQPFKIYAPPWDTSRPHLTGDFLLDPYQRTTTALSTFPTQTQHSLATQDAINALLGVRPEYATIQRVTLDDNDDNTNDMNNNSNITTLTYSISQDKLQRSHTHISPFLSRILPLATHHSIIRSFIESSRLPNIAGYIRQALSSAMSDLLIDYHTFLLRLEAISRNSKDNNNNNNSNNHLTLQKLLYYIQPTLRSMSLLSSIVNITNNKKGGAVLDSLYSLAITFVGSPDEKSVLAFLLGRTAAPLLDTLSIWLSSGIINDPYNEFFIAHDSSFKGTNLDHRTWEMKFTINAANVPILLQPFIEKILRAGKYLSVLRDCNVNIQKALFEAESTFGPGELPSISNLGDNNNTNSLFNDTHLSSVKTKENHIEIDRFHLSGATLLSSDASRRISTGVERAFKLSSCALMTYLTKNVRIRDRLNSLKKFFLIEQGDYLIHFLDSASIQLKKPANLISRSSLTSLLELSLRSSAINSNSFIDDLSIELMDKHLSLQISALLSMPSSILSSSNDVNRHESQQQQSQLQQQKSSIKPLSLDSNNNSTNKIITGFEALSLSYNLKWPIKLIVSPMDITKYQLLFRYLFYAKYVERELIECWCMHNQAKGPLRLYTSSFIRSFILRNRMLQFIRSILYYNVADVIEPSWVSFDNHLRSAKTIDDIMTHHANFLSVCSLQSLLSDERHQNVFKQLCETCLAFVKYTRKFDEIIMQLAKLNTKVKGKKQQRKRKAFKNSHRINKNKNDSDNEDEDDIEITEKRKALEDKLKDKSYAATLAKFETSFDMHFGNLLDGVSALSKSRANIHLANLCERLDAGGYYTNLKQRSLASLGTVPM